MAIEKPLSPLDVLQRYSVREACRYLRISAPKFYETVRAGRIKTMKDGRRRFVPGSEIARLSA